MYLKEENTYAGLDYPATGAGRGINSNISGASRRVGFMYLEMWRVPG